MKYLLQAIKETPLEVIGGVIVLVISFLVMYMTILLFSNMY